MTDWHIDHGTLLPGIWSIRCDVKGCESCLAPLSDPTQPDAVQRQHVRVMAEANGWYVAQDKLHTNTRYDLCPEHAPPMGVRR
jgi:hypothetical protein